MKKHGIVELPEIKLVGLSIKIQNALNAEDEINAISEMVQSFYADELRDRIQNIKTTGFPVVVYTEYKINEYPFVPYCETEEDYEYKSFFGDEVTSFEGISEDLKRLIIPSQSYAKFSASYAETTWEEILPALWQEIRDMSPSELGGQRTYLADFEIYDEVKDILEIYVGIEK